jgi:hypothetical protein
MRRGSSHNSCHKRFARASDRFGSSGSSLGGRARTLYWPIYGNDQPSAAAKFLMGLTAPAPGIGCAHNVVVRERHNERNRPSVMQIPPSALISPNTGSRYTASIASVPLPFRRNLRRSEVLSFFQSLSPCRLVWSESRPVRRRITGRAS